MFSPKAPAFPLTYITSESKSSKQVTEWYQSESVCSQCGTSSSVYGEDKQ